MSEELRKYHAIVWSADPDKPGIRSTYLAKSPEEAQELLEREHGKGKIFTLHNEEDAERPR